MGNWGLGFNIKRLTSIFVDFSITQVEIMYCNFKVTSEIVQKSSEWCIGKIIYYSPHMSGLSDIFRFRQFRSSLKCCRCFEVFEVYQMIGSRRRKC